MPATFYSLQRAVQIKELALQENILHALVIREQHYNQQRAAFIQEHFEMLFIKWNCSSSTQERGRERTAGEENRIYSASGGSMTWLKSSMTKVMNLQLTDLLTISQT